MNFVDIHTHASWDSGLIQIIDRSGEPFSATKIKGYYSKGIHPWYVKANRLTEDIEKLENKLNDDSFLAIGECGLDKLCSTDFDLQLNAFRKQIELAEKYHKPLIVHCVKAFNELIQIRQEFNCKQAWIVHGFNGSPQLAKELIDFGMFVSFGFDLNQKQSKAYKCIDSIPKNRLFLETDTSSKTIEDVYILANNRLGIGIAQLKSQIWANFKVLFQ